MSNGRNAVKVARCRAQLLAGATTFACCYCRQVFAAREATLEHRVPLSHGGTWHVDNLALSCLGCNMRRNKLVLKLASIIAILRAHPHLRVGIVFHDGEWHFEAPTTKCVRGAA